MGKIFVLLILNLVQTLFSQTSDTTYKYWLTVGGWVEGSFIESSNKLSYNFFYKNNFFSVGFLNKGNTTAYKHLGPGLDGFSYQTVQCLIGKSYFEDCFLVSSFIGPSYVFGKKATNEMDWNGKSKLENYYTVGMHMENQFVFKFVKEIGVGVELYGNLNFKKNFSGVNVIINMGNGK